ncbi:hypothetical protein QQS21_001475 [Conoideocrella luteorostrata]|uniref:Uncharacterized protein n=1 Tax=Conoideocrella luteorostrata TaxID=1105319 RepID=A0AAJ0FXI1_9HYPO|nr:hypothetical protein QQS21_001475 [Conoideocrella luteorostrata]
MSEKPWVVMPLYYYPISEATWKPLYDAISVSPDINFLVIVNPNSGPGAGPLPGNDYVSEVPKLNSFPNVRTVGYVRIHYCRKPLEETCSEIDRYAGWDRHHSIPGLYVEGIYVDETPNHVSDDRSDYLDRLRHFIKCNEGLLGERMVVHNPGTPPEGSLGSFGDPDLVCICEEPYELYQSRGVQRRLDEFSPKYERCAYQISGIPADEMDGAVQELCRRGQYVFATDLAVDFYESFGPSWHAFVEAVRKASCP